MGIKSSIRFARAFVALILTPFAFVNVSTLGAQAVEVSAVTIVDSEGDAKGSTWNVASGVLTATGTVNINSADIEAELATSDLEISVGSLTVDSPISWSASTILSLTSAGTLAINSTIKSTGATAGIELSSPADYVLNVEEGASIQLTGAEPTLKINSTPFTVVNTRAQLLALTSSSTNVALGRSITLTDAIGTALIQGAFASTFDGLGNEVSGMNISAAANGATNLGFFAELRGATVRHLGVTDASIQTTSTSLSNSIRAGIIAGDVGDAAAATKTKTAYTTKISKVWTSGTVTALDTSETANEDKQWIFFAGGLVGSFTNGTLHISDSHSSVSVGSSGTVSSNLALGGILGDSNSSSIHIEITRAYSTGTIVQGDPGGTYVGNGGIIGVLMTDATSFVTNSFSWSNIIAGHPSSGGIFGYLMGGPSVTYSYTTYGTLGNGSGTKTGSQANVTPSTWTELPAGYDPAVWRYISGALPTLFDQVTPQTPLYVKVVAPTDGTYATMSYAIVNASGGAVDLSSLDLASPTGVAEYTISPAVPTGTFKVSYTGGLKLTGEKAPFYFLAPYTTPTSVTITSAKTAQTVTWAPTNTTATADEGKVTPNSAASTNGDGAITYSVQNAGTTGCSIDSAKPPVITVTASGDCVVRASAAGTDNYASAYKDVVFTVTVAEAQDETETQIVTWEPTNTTVVAGSKSITPNSAATTSGDGEITYTIQDGGKTGCTISDAKPPLITFTTTGTCVIRASAAATESYESGYKDVSFVYEESTTSLTLDLDIEIGASVSFAPVSYETTGLKPSSAWEIVVRSTPRTIAEGVAGESGVVTGSAYLPSSISAGWHSITFTGTDNSGGSVSTIVWFEVSKSGNLVKKQDSEPPKRSTDDDGENSSDGSSIEQTDEPLVKPADEPSTESTTEPTDKPSAIADSSAENDSPKWVFIPIALLVLGGSVFLFARLRSQRN